VFLEHRELDTEIIHTPQKNACEETGVMQLKPRNAQDGQQITRKERRLPIRLENIKIHMTIISLVVKNNHHYTKHFTDPTYKNLVRLKRSSYFQIT
jgi:hypothetical protein